MRMPMMLTLGAIAAIAVVVFAFGCNYPGMGNHHGGDDSNAEADRTLSDYADTVDAMRNEMERYYQNTDAKDRADRYSTAACLRRWYVRAPGRALTMMPIFRN